jgi:two-component system, NarL family, nitrate/nitrite sensor histidine kinase NarX
MAFREALQNVVKHSKASEVTITLAMHEKHLIIRVSDNGCGLRDQPQKSDRNGLEILKSRLAGIGGICDIHDSNPGGVEVEMRAPMR